MATKEPAAVAAKATTVRELCADPTLAAAIASMRGGSTQVLQKIIQRNRYKHRCAPHFKALIQACQCLRDAKRFFGEDLLSDISKDCHEGGVCSNSSRVAESLHRLHAYMDSLCSFTHAVYPAVRALELELSRGVFMAENLTFYALLAEISETVKSSVLPRMELIFNAFLEIASYSIPRDQAPCSEFEGVKVDPRKLITCLQPVILEIDGFYAQLKPNSDAILRCRDEDLEDIGEVVALSAKDDGDDNPREYRAKEKKSVAHMTDRQKTEMSSWLDGVDIGLGNRATGKIERNERMEETQLESPRDEDPEINSGTGTGRESQDKVGRELETKDQVPINWLDDDQISGSDEDDTSFNKTRTYSLQSEGSSLRQTESNAMQPKPHSAMSTVSKEKSREKNKPASSFAVNDVGRFSRPRHRKVLHKETISPKNTKKNVLNNDIDQGIGQPSVVAPTHTGSWSRRKDVVKAASSDLYKDGKICLAGIVPQTRLSEQSIQDQEPPILSLDVQGGKTVHNQTVGSEALQELKEQKASFRSRGKSSGMDTDRESKGYKKLEDWLKSDSDKSDEDEANPSDHIKGQVTSLRRPPESDRGSAKKRMKMDQIFSQLFRQ